MPLTRRRAVSALAVWLCLGAWARFAIAAATEAAAAPGIHVIDEKERIALQQTDNVRLSLPTEGDVEAWATPGLRVQLGFAYGAVHGFGPALSFNGPTFTLRPSLRIDRRWGLALALLYGTGPGGLRWSATLEPTFFPWRQLGISVGLGYGGLVVSLPEDPNATFRGAAVAVSRDLSGDERLQSCTGSALSSVVRVEYLFVVGPLFASGPFAQASAQWTHCEATFGRTDAETGRPVVLTQWWPQGALDLGWWLAWR
jgi:hypothetical protein